MTILELRLAVFTCLRASLSTASRLNRLLMIRRGRDTPAGRDDQRTARAELMIERRAEVGRLASLQGAEPAAKQAAAMEQAESPPVTYVAAAVGAPQQTRQP